MRERERGRGEGGREIKTFEFFYFLAPSVTGTIVGGVVGSLLFNMIVVLIIPIICCVMRLRKRGRRPPQAPNTTTGATGVAYTVQGQGISYVQPGTALPPGMVLVPAAQPNNRVRRGSG